jgi:hypothetical protein
MMRKRLAHRERPLLLAVIPKLLSGSSCGEVYIFRSFNKPDIPYFIDSVEPDSNDFALDCTTEIVNDLAKIGPPPNIYYEVWNDLYPR